MHKSFLCQAFMHLSVQQTAGGIEATRFKMFFIKLLNYTFIDKL
jgi:hypothetical protein